jgi:hypothetical protein
MKISPQEEALQLCQDFGMTTLFAEDCNDGFTLPLRIAKKCALIHVNRMLKYFEDYDYCGQYMEEINYYEKVKTEIENL